MLTQQFRQRVAIHIQQIELEQDDGRYKLGCNNQRGMAGIGDASMSSSDSAELISLSRIRIRVDSRARAVAPPSDSQAWSCRECRESRFPRWDSDHVVSLCQNISVVCAQPPELSVRYQTQTTLDGRCGDPLVVAQAVEMKDLPIGWQVCVNFKVQI
jgi:hypothetical protein